MLLLDSQVLLWALDDGPRLGKRARERIGSAAGVHVSSATIWELTIKAMLGKIEIPDDLAQRIAAQGYLELAVTHEHAAAIGRLPEIARHDPFDRLLVAQALCSGLNLLTADRILLGLGHRFVLDATK
jgi:PIN domain nuclease of toxin-antitoxin system